MSDPKPFASLSPTLLARKGGAKPAMRRQVHYPDSLARAAIEDDLGWNDMGDEAPFADLSAPAGEVVPIKAQVELPAKPEKPAVVQHQEAIARQVIAPAPVAAKDPEHAPARAPVKTQALATPKASPTPRRSALENGRRAAFTLRMDADRHLKLRLACTIRNRSAQQLMTEALDKLIDELPELDALAAQVAGQR